MSNACSDSAVWFSRMAIKEVLLSELGADGMSPQQLTFHFNKKVASRNLEQSSRELGMFLHTYCPEVRAVGDHKSKRYYWGSSAARLTDSEGAIA